MPQPIISITRALIYICLLAAPAQLTAQVNPTSVSGTQTKASARIAWEARPKISRYRLQLALDEQFSDIVFDKLVMGSEYTVTEIAPGRYFWRVAPAAGETGIYSKPLPVTVSPEGSAASGYVPPSTFLTPPIDAGWRTATGMIELPQAAKLRTGASADIIGVNSYGMVYAIDSEKGISLWSARYRPDAKKGEPTNSDGTQPFAPLLIEEKDLVTKVLAAFDGGVRALEGASGKQLWRTQLPGVAISGLALGSSKDNSTSLAVFDNSQTLSFLKADSGQIISQTKLDGFVVGRPIAFKYKDENAVLVALNNGTLDVRNQAGVSLLAIRLDAAITTAPLLVRPSRGSLVMIGTESGLVALNGSDLNPLWRVATEGDAPQGMLASADLDNDGAEEVLMVTRRGRAVAINLTNGKIKWYAEGATDAALSVFADVNGDGARDVLVAGGTAFALGFSGKDGKLIWKADEAAAARAAGSEGAQPRALVAVQTGNAAPPLLVGADPGRTGLRAVGLPAGSLK